jgi:hypothetical protein
MEWIHNHLAALGLTTLATLGGFAAFFRKPALAAWRLYRRAQLEVSQTQERLADGYQGLTALREMERNQARAECDRLKAEIKEVKAVLRARVLAEEVRDDIDRQRRALIRGLKDRLHERRIDFSDLEESLEEQFDHE